MSFEVYLLYLFALAAFFATPPDVSQFLIISNSMRHGLKKSTATIFGDLTANSLQMTAAAFGLTAVIATSANAILWIKWAGVAYLLWLAFRMLRRNPSNNTLEANRQGSFAALFKQGFLTSSANPYAVVFFGALFPQFIDTTLPILPQLLILGVTYLVVDGLILLVWGWMAVKASNRLKKVGGIWINRASAFLMLCAAALLAGKNLEVEPAK